MTNELTTLSQAERAVAEAKTVPDLMDVRDTATALREWARSRSLGVDAENLAAAMIIRAERKIGALLPEVLLYKGGVPTPSPAGTGFTLSELGLSRNDSARFQTLATIPDEDFEVLLADKMAAGERISRVDFLRLIGKNEQAKDPRSYSPPREDKYADLIAAIRAILGWDGKAYGENGLHQVRLEDLQELGLALRALLTAYNEVRDARSGR